MLRAGSPQGSGSGLGEGLGAVRPEIPGAQWLGAWGWGAPGQIATARMRGCGQSRKHE